MTPHEAPGAVTRIVVGISGASGAIYGIRFLELLRAIPGVESHLIVSDAGKRLQAFRVGDLPVAPSE